jgi:hypothetical protein
MIQKLKMLTFAILCSIAASATARAAAAPMVTNATVLNTVSLQFTVLSQKQYPPNMNRALTNKAGTLITVAEQQGALSTAGVLGALAAATGDNFNPKTSRLVLARTYSNTPAYTVVLKTTVPPTTNVYVSPVFAGLSNAFEVTIATNLAFSVTGTQWEVVDAAGNVFVFTNGNGSFNFNFNASIVSGSEQAVGGVPIAGTEAGTEAGMGSFSVNAPSNWVFQANGFGTAVLTPKKLGLGTNGVPVFVDTRSSSSTVAGAGTMGGTVVNGIPTNDIPVLLKGSMIESFWKVVLNQ